MLWKPALSSRPAFSFLLLRVEVEAGPLRDEEGVGEGPAEAVEGLLEPLAASASSGTASAWAASPFR